MYMVPRKKYLRLHGSLLGVKFCEMSKESTLSTASGCMDVGDASLGGVTANSQNENGGSGNSETGEVLCYQRKFFHQTTGSLPKDEGAACGLWSYRKTRPKKDRGSTDMVPAYGEAMLNKMRAIRESLQSFIMDEVLSDMQQMARFLQMRIESNHKIPVTLFDFKGIIKRLNNNPRNHVMVYDIFRKFQRDKFGMANAI